MFDEVQRGWLAGDDYRVAAEAAGVVELPDEGTPPPGRLPEQVSTGRWEDDDPPRGRPMTVDLVERLAVAPPETLERLTLAVAAMHEPDRSGRCRRCHPDRRGWRWWRRTTSPCPTWRVMRVQVDAEPAPPRWTPA